MSQYAAVFLIFSVVSIVIYRKFFLFRSADSRNRINRNPFSFSKMSTPSIADGFSFGGFPLSFDDARLHFEFIGSQGSGKTILIRLLMQSACYRMVHGPEKVRCLVYDSKTDLCDKIAGFDGMSTDQICILNPMDSRCTAWDMSADLTNTLYSQEFAETLIPYDKNKMGENSHFILSAQNFVGAVIDALNYHAPRRWELRDVLNATRSLQRLRALFLSCPETEDLVDQHFAVQKTVNSIKSSMDTHLRIFRPIAAAWHAAAKERDTISIRDWLEGHGKILVMGNNPKAKAGLQAINRLIFSEVSKAIRSVPGEVTDSQNWIFLDELSELQKLESLKDLMITGRSKGAAVVLGFQDVLGIDAEYGKELSREIIGQPQNAAFLHINPLASETQKYASECMGKWEFKRYERGYSESSSSQGETHSNTFQERYLIQDRWLPSQFESDLPKPTRENGATGLFRIKSGKICEGFPALKSGWFTQNIPGNIIFGEDGDLSRLRKPNPEFPPFEERAESDTYLTDWNAEDFERLGPEIWKITQKPSSSAPDISKYIQEQNPHPKL